MNYVLMLVIGLAVGIVARFWKDRNGVIWGVLTFAFMLPLTPFYMMGSTALFNAGCILIGIIVAISLATLPATKVCPFCKRRIHVDAVVCSHCRSSLLTE